MPFVTWNLIYFLKLEVHFRSFKIIFQHFLCTFFFSSSFGCSSEDSFGRLEMSPTVAVKLELICH